MLDKELLQFPSPSLGNFIYIDTDLVTNLDKAVSVPISGELYLYKD